MPGIPADVACEEEVLEVVVRLGTAEAGGAGGELGVASHSRVLSRYMISR